MTKYFEVKDLLERGTNDEINNFLRYCYNNNKVPSSSICQEWNQYNEHQELLKRFAADLYNDCDDVYELLRMTDEAVADMCEYDNYPSSALELHKWINTNLNRIKNNG